MFEEEGREVPEECMNCLAFIFGVCPGYCEVGGEEYDEENGSIIALPTRRIVIITSAPPTEFSNIPPQSLN
jgi:hypothetical protein